ncbi:cysteine desulfurase family protein [Rathayibacter soli]|uniref:cysteine desulfurase family protein n=1 Tax=Rathayibacter soli TaxID=3144168 RepID=UPI0027E3CE4A|nr:cysteine desulfurase family protein [Glaciibacter superstes]
MTVYLDHAATTPASPAAIEAYARAMATVGNPSSIHSAGQAAKRMLEEAREQVAATLGCEPIEVVFTSGGTEAINLALKGLYWQRNHAAGRPARAHSAGRPASAHSAGRVASAHSAGRVASASERIETRIQTPTDTRAATRTRILVPGGEHHATIDTVEWLEQYEGATVQWLPLDETGALRLDALEQALTDDPESIALVTMIAANNEVGTVQPVRAAAALAAAAGVPLHVDAVAAYGHLPIDFSLLRTQSSSDAAGLVALSVSAHKIGGPVGIGALALSRHASVVPLIHGGGQQRQVRSGTQDVAAAVSFAAAAREATDVLAEESARLSALRDRVIAGVRATVPDALLNGPEPPSTDRNRAHPDAVVRLSMNAHFSFPGCEGDSLLFLLDAAGISVSTGSACQAGIPEPSHVLRAMGRDEVASRGALRVTLGRTTTDADITAFLTALPSAYAQAARAGLADRETELGIR